MTTYNELNLSHKVAGDSNVLHALVADCCFRTQAGRQRVCSTTGRDARYVAISAELWRDLANALHKLSMVDFMNCPTGPVSQHFMGLPVLIVNNRPAAYIEVL